MIRKLPFNSQVILIVQIDLHPELFLLIWALLAVESVDVNALGVIPARTTGAVITQYAQGARTPDATLHSAMPNCEE